MGSELPAGFTLDEPQQAQQPIVEPETVAPTPSPDLPAGFTVDEPPAQPTEPQSVSLALTNDQKIDNILSKAATGQLSEKQTKALEELKKRGVDKGEEFSISKLGWSLGQRLRKAFTGEERETVLTETLPEFRETPPVREFGEDPASTLKMAAGLLSSYTPEGQMNIIKEYIPEAEFIKDEKGNIIVEVGGELSVLNKPGFSGADAMQALTGVLSFVPSGKVASMGKTVLQKLGVGTLAAGATEQATQEAAIAAGAKEERDPLKTALASVFGGASELIGPAMTYIKGLKSSQAAKKLGAEAVELPLASESVEVAKEAAKKTGIPLYKAQQTLIPSELQKQSYIAQLPAGAQKSMTALKTQNKASYNAVEDMLSSIAPAESIATGAEKFRTAAQKAVEAQKTIRKEKTSKLFQDAFKNREPVDISPIKDFVKDKIKDFPKGGEVDKTLKKINTLMEGSPNLKQLQNIKLELDQMVSKFGENSLGNTTKREVLEIKDELLSVMDKVSPEYKTARKAFADASPEVEAMKESIVGKVAAFKDTNLKRVSRVIFDPTENIEAIKNAKKAINSVDPDAWNRLLRSEIERRMENISADLAEGGIFAVENIPGLLEKHIFGAGKHSKVLYAAAGKETAKNLRYLQSALKRAKLGRVSGSPTAIRKEIDRELRGGISLTLRNYFKSPFQAAAATGEDIVFDKRVRSMAEAMFSPEYAADMAKVRALKPSSSKAGKMLKDLLTKVEKYSPEIKAVAQQAKKTEAKEL